jgi:hypothetical protein
MHAHLHNCMCRPIAYLPCIDIWVPRCELLPYMYGHVHTGKIMIRLTYI